MYNLGMPVPPGFTTTASAYNYFLEETGLIKEIYGILKKIDVENTAELEETSKKIKEMIIKAELPEDMEKEILEAYEHLSFKDEDLYQASETAKLILKKGKEPIFVAVRSSATAEDTEAASFAGQQETFLNVKGNGQLILSIKKCFASLFGARSIYYRVQKGFEHEDVLIAVTVQTMINSEKSGVIFSKDPVEFSLLNVILSISERLNCSTWLFVLTILISCGVEIFKVKAMHMISINILFIVLPPDYFSKIICLDRSCSPYLIVKI